MTAAAERPAERSRLRRVAELPLLIAIALVLAFVIKTFVMQAFFIPSASMLPTLQIDDRVLVEKVSYRFREPARGEVVVFRRPGAVTSGGGVAGAVRDFLVGLGLAAPDADVDLIKRVVGLPGERIEVRDGRVLIDGRPLREPYTRDERRDFGPVTVPDRTLFMMGDNRPLSDDSRFSLGPVPVSAVVGRAFVIIWPPTDLRWGLRAEYPRLQASLRLPTADGHGYSRRNGVDGALPTYPLPSGAPPA